MPLKASISAQSIAAIARKLEELKKPIDQDTADEIGQEVVREMKDQISKGISPIKGNGRFPRYKNPDKYPKRKKPNTPVNLYLGGEFQDSLTHESKQSKSGYKTEIFYEGSDQDDKESGHREGVHGQPKRPTIPQGTEDFSERIRRVFSKIYRDRINSIIGNKG